MSDKFKAIITETTVTTRIVEANKSLYKNEAEFENNVREALENCNFSDLGDEQTVDYEFLINGKNLNEFESE